LGKIKVLSSSEVCSILKKFGFNEVRRKGSHIVMQKISDQGSLTLPVPNHDEIKIGTLLSIIRQSGLQREEFTQKDK
jgi:predicted RNA binding protein YcfA (HicA-like mRNA interferase family)